MNAGMLRQKVKIQKYEKSQDGIGNANGKWNDYKTAYAYVNGLRGKEYWEAAAVHQEHTVEFIFRWKPFFDGIDTRRYRIFFGGNAYNITLIDNIQYRNKTVKIKAVIRDGDNGQH